AMAIDVRGTLEGMAARLLAEQGVTREVLEELQACVDEGRLLVEQALLGRDTPVDTARWAAMTARFHRALVEGAANPALASALDHIARTPMAG
ncbi:FCD domain-containing protein, partial [Acinetobacter baumannii]|nr:FCD domain-containing protein [Acinetobacter baumannii]